MRDNPHVAADLLCLWGLRPEVVAWELLPSLGWEIIGRLQVEPSSVARARELGGERWRDWVGWGNNSEMLANIADGVANVALVAAVRELPKWAKDMWVSRPSLQSGFVDGDGQAGRPRSVADMDWGRVLANLGI